MKKVFKRCLVEIAHRPYIQRALRKRHQGAIILSYHGIEEQIREPKIQGLHTHVKQFEQQLTYLKKHFEIVSLDYIYECLRNGHPLDGSQVALTFDDGYKNNFTIAAPLLYGHDMPFTIFVTTGYIGTSEILPATLARMAIFLTTKTRIFLPSINEKLDTSSESKRVESYLSLVKKIKYLPAEVVTSIKNDLKKVFNQEQWIEIRQKFHSESFMSWHDIQNLSQYNAAIGAHTCDHTILHGQQSKREIKRQIQDSKQIVEKWNGQECKYFAYPNGRKEYLCQEAFETVYEQGFALAVTTIFGEVQSHHNPLILPRVSTTNSVDGLVYNLQIKRLSNREYATWIQ